MVQKQLAGDVERRPRVTLLDSTPRWRAMSLLAAVLVVVAAAVAITLWVTGRGGRSPEDTARRFLEATSCGQLRRLADDRADLRLTSTGCQTLIDAARGRRTYADPLAGRHLHRSLLVADASIVGDRAQVKVTARYSENGRALPSERIGVVLVRAGDDWRVDNWGALR